MSPWQRIIEQLNGTLEIGFWVYFGVLAGAWAIWIYTYFASEMLSPRTFIRWGLYFSILILGLYSVKRVRHPAPLAPVRVWVQPFFVNDDADSENADLARYALERTLYQLDDNIAPFQTLDLADSILTRNNPAESKKYPQGAFSIKATYALESSYEETGNLVNIKIKYWKLDWLGKAKESGELTASGASAALAGKKAALQMMAAWKKKIKDDSYIEMLNEESITSLYKSSTLKYKKDRQQVLLAGFTTPDSTNLFLWEELAKLYLNWHYPMHKVDAEYALSKAYEVNQYSSKALFTHGMIKWRLGGHKEEAVASWKLAYLADRRNPDPLISLAWLNEKEIRDLRLGTKENMLRYALRTRPSNPQIRRALARVYYPEMLRQDPAVEILDEGLELNPHHLELLMGRGIMRLTIRDWAGAEVDFRHILEIDSTLQNVWYNLGIALYTQKNLEDARWALEHSVNLEGPRDANYYLARVYDRLGEYDLALDQYRKRWVSRELEKLDKAAFESQKRIKEIQNARMLNVDPPPLKGKGWEMEAEATQETGEAAGDVG